MTGVGEYLKKQNADIQIVAVEPESSAVLSTGIGGSHKIQGIGAGFVPEILNTSVYDEIITVKDEDAFATGKLIGYKEGILVGISSGAALWAAIQLAKETKTKEKVLSCCCRIQETDIYRHLSLQNKKQGKKEDRYDDLNKRKVCIACIARSCRKSK